MKLPIITILIMMLIWQGCKTFQTDNQSRNINYNDYESEEIKIVLNNGAEIISMPYLHTFVTEPSDFIIGRIVAQKYLHFENGTEHFSGKILGKDIDSAAAIEISDGSYTKFYLKTRQPIIFQDKDYLRIIPSDSTGFFVKGVKVKNEIQTSFEDKLNLNSINHIEIKKPNGVITLSICVAVIAGTILFIDNLKKSLPNW